MGTVLHSPPVYLTLAQVRFNPVLALSDYVPTIQEAFRRAGYTDFKRLNLVSIQLGSNSGGGSAPVALPCERFQFGDAAATQVFMLDAQGLTLQSTDYGNFEAFCSRFMAGLSIVHEAVGLAFTERVGLRFLDRVMPQAGETLQQYLVGSAHGLNSCLAGRPLHSYMEALNEVGGIKLLARVVVQDGPLAFPPDIQPNEMKVQSRFASFVGPSAILDNDGFMECRELFSLEAVEQQLRAIHEVVAAAFKATVTPHALATWGA